MDSLADLLEHGAEEKRARLEKAGEALSASDVAKLLHVSRRVVDKRRRERELLAVSGAADFVYPSCQFDQNGVIPGLPEVLKLLPPHEWTALAFLVTTDERLCDVTPLDALKQNDPLLCRRVHREARILAGDGFG